MENIKQTKPVIAGIGEILWDILGDSEKLGGAPINFAYHANGLGAEAYAISTVGDDNRGLKAIQELQKNMLSTDYISIQKNETTGFVLATIDDKGVANYEFPDDVAWDKLSTSFKILDLANRVDAVCFGSLAQRSDASKKTIVSFLKQMKTKSLRVFDLNLRQNFYTTEIIQTSLENANILKLNDDEILEIAKIENLTGDIESQLQTLLEKYNLKMVILTLGDSGSLLVTPKETSRHSGYATKVIDTIGAGDSFTATVILGLLKGLSLKDINEHANRVAAYVCSQKGAMSHLPPEMRIF